MGYNMTIYPNIVRIYIPLVELFDAVIMQLVYLNLTRPMTPSPTTPRRQEPHDLLGRGHRLEEPPVILLPGEDPVDPLSQIIRVVLPRLDLHRRLRFGRHRRRRPPDQHIPGDSHGHAHRHVPEVVPLAPDHKGALIGAAGVSLGEILTISGRSFAHAS